MRIPMESSIYWDSVGSQRSTSGSSGDCSSGSASRHYVDPWDLQNYVYLRRRSVSGLMQSRHHRRHPGHHRVSQESRAHFGYWYSREPGYDSPGSVEELYCGLARGNNASCHYHQPIYEDEVPDYVAPFPVYAPLSDVRHGDYTEDHRRNRHRCKSTSIKDLHKSINVDSSLPPMSSVELEYRPHHGLDQDKYSIHIIPPAHLDLNTYGHLKIDYTKNWNSLHRKIGK